MPDGDIHVLTIAHQSIRAMSCTQCYNSIQNQLFITQLSFLVNAIRQDSGIILVQMLQQYTDISLMLPGQVTRRVRTESGSTQVRLCFPYTLTDTPHIRDVQTPAQNRQPLWHAQPRPYRPQLAGLDVQEAYAPFKVRKVHAIMVEPGGRRELAARRQHAAVAAPFPAALTQKGLGCERGSGRRLARVPKPAANRSARGGGGRRLARIAAPSAATGNEQHRRQSKRERPANAHGDGEPRAAHSPAWSGMARAAPARSSSSETGSMRAMRAHSWPKGSRRRP